MIKKYKIVFDRNSSNKDAIQKSRLNPPFFLFGISREQLDYNLEQIEKENPKRFEILKKYFDNFESEK